MNSAWAAVLGFAAGAYLFHAVHLDASEALERELKVLRHTTQSLRTVVCEEGEVYVATRSDGAPWTVRCVKPGRVK
jgi:hypothetical protein